MNPSERPPTDDRPTLAELLRAEDAAWREVHALVDPLSVEQIETPGYYPEGWSVKDLLAHIGSWLAEAGVVLERIRAGTYRAEEIDVDALNQRFLEAMKGVPLADVLVQCAAARAQMLHAWGTLPARTSDADFWIRKAGAEHYEEHLPRLRGWVAEIRRGQPVA